MIEVRDPREETLEDAGELLLIDPETGEQVRVDTRSRALRDRYAEAAAADRAEVAANVRRAGADHVVLSTRGEWLRPLLVALAKRERRRDLVTFAWPFMLIGLVIVPIVLLLDLLARRRRARYADRLHATSACCARSCRARRRGAATCRSRCCWPRWPRSSSAWPVPSAPSRSRASRRR